LKRTTSIARNLKKTISNEVPVQVEVAKSNSEKTVWNEEGSLKNIKKPEDFLPLRKLGRGSFGDVYLVKELSSGRLFAMKALCKRRSEDTSWLRYVITERDVLAGSECPFIVKMHYAF
jgi:serine/threonine protein kinase